MNWNISAECVSSIILCIIWVYSRKGNPLPTLTNKFFQICFLVTFLAIISNIASTLMLFDYQSVPLALTWIANTIYFIMTPLMGLFYFYYVIAFIFENQKNIFKILMISSIPSIVYLVFVLTNPINKLLFDINPLEGYVRGPYIALTYIVFYIYCFACPVVVLVNGRRLNADIRRILTVFPIIAAAVIIIQQFIPEYMLTGTAATCALLIIYLYLQNKQITLDHLTGLSNRHSFLQMIEIKLQKRPDVPFTIFVLSLRNFKTINDKFGQLNGNRFLQALASFLRSLASADNIFRYSGDEFAILLDSADRDKQRALLDKLTHRMSMPWEIQDSNGFLQYAVAIVEYPNSSDSAEGLVDGIESTVAHAKSNTKEHYSYCTPEMLEQAKRKNRIFELIKEYLASDAFDIYYQPILSLDTMSFNKAEALLRMNGTPLGPLSPAEFIPIAEDTGLIIYITYQVLEKVCGFVRKLMDSNIDIVSVSVNFSSVQFVQENVTERVFQIIEKNGIPYSKIKIEITERVLMDNYPVVSDFINAIHAKGVRFALDDFGTGYSNISTVLGFPINTVKLDKSLIWSSIENPKSEAVVRHMVAAFKEIGIDVLAEGVENEEHRDFVIDCGCDMIQGFLYSRPVPADQACLFLGKKLSGLRFERH